MSIDGNVAPANRDLPAPLPLGTGVDLVAIGGFAQLLGTPGSTFLTSFHPQELQRAQTLAAEYGEGRRTEFLAGRWAAKEAFIKAWDSTLLGAPPVLDDAHQFFHHILVSQDPWGRPFVSPQGKIRELLSRHWSQYQISLSITHDHDNAVATCTFLKLAGS